MASHSQVLECLKAVRFRLNKARSIVQANNLTPKLMQSMPEMFPEESAAYNARSALITEMRALAENFTQAQKAATSIKFFSKCFGFEKELKAQRNILTHQYGLITAADKIDWERVYRTVDVLYPQLEGPLADAIATLENEELDLKDKPPAPKST